MRFFKRPLTSQIKCKPEKLLYLYIYLKCLYATVLHINSIIQHKPKVSKLLTTIFYLLGLFLLLSPIIILYQTVAPSPNL